MNSPEGITMFEAIEKYLSMNEQPQLPAEFEQLGFHIAVDRFPYPRIPSQTLEILDRANQKAVISFTEDGTKGKYDKLLSLSDESENISIVFGINKGKKYPLRPVNNGIDKPYIHEYPGFDQIKVLDGKVFGINNGVPTEIYYPLPPSK